LQKKEPSGKFPQKSAIYFGKHYYNKAFTDMDLEQAPATPPNRRQKTPIAFLGQRN